MKKTLWIFIIFIITGCSSMHEQVPESGDQKIIFKNWVLSRCLSHALTDKDQKDALNTASAYLEASNLPVEKLRLSEPLIEESLKKNVQGSIPGTFNIKTCIDLSNSGELEKLYKKIKRPIGNQ